MNENNLSNADLFLANNITGDLLLDLNYTTLKEIGYDI
jgi:hypothetical protein